MANVWQKPEKFAGTALAILRKQIKGAGLFSIRYGITDFSGAKGDVVNVKRPPILRARDAGFRSRNGLQMDDLIQSKIQVALTRHPYSRVGLSPEEATLDDVNYVRDVQAPQVVALVEDFDETIAAALRGSTPKHSVTFTPGTGSDLLKDPRLVSQRAKRYMDEEKVPASGRYWLVGSAVSEAVAGHDKLKSVDASGLPEALREGVVGKLSGFTVVDWPSLGDDESYFVHETAVALATVAPKVPNGATGGAQIAAQGLGVTQVWSFDDSTLTDTSTVHAFTGAAEVEDPKVDRDGRIIVNQGTGEAEMEFVRAVKVIFTEQYPESTTTTSTT